MLCPQFSAGFVDGEREKPNQAGWWCCQMATVSAPHNFKCGTDLLLGLVRVEKTATSPITYPVAVFSF